MTEKKGIDRVRGLPGIEVVEPKPGTGAITFLKKRDKEFDEVAPERDDDGSGTDG